MESQLASSWEVVGRQAQAPARHRYPGCSAPHRTANLRMFHQVVPASALGPEAAGPPLYIALLPPPTSMSVYRVGPARALHAAPQRDRE